jgi:uncharacterized protein (TIGR03790 family)
VSLLAWAGTVRAALQPDQVFVVYNRNLPESRSLAEYYVQQRGLPATHSIGLDLPSTDDITREAYLAKLRNPLRGWLRHENLQDKIRCLVTIYGVPLRVVGTRVVPADKPLLKEIVTELGVATSDLQDLMATLAKLAAQSQPASQPADKTDPTNLLSAYEKLRDQAVQRLQAARTTEEAARLTAELEEPLKRGEGVQTFVEHMRSNDPAGQKLIAALQADAAKRRVHTKQLLAGCPRGDKQAEAHQAVRELYGLHGLIEHLLLDKEKLEGKETHAAVDSELSLMWCEDYPLYRWVPNPMCWRVRHSPEFAPMIADDPLDRPIVMVARLDAPTPKIVRRMIDDAIATEKKGLAGTIYIDARGMKPSDRGYGQYDEDLRQATILLKKTPMQVVEDNQSDLFGVGQCPDAALYSGWYSLGKYVDSFTWNQGAVAYHIASSEAVSLHNPKGQYWCKRMLEEGVTATLGPVAEPYLTSFPRPRDFFGLLLTGQYTLAEVYWHTCPLTSWMQTLLGDPLYTPFKNKPLLQVEDVFPAKWLKEPTTQPTKVAGK